MDDLAWMDILGLNTSQIDDIRYVGYSYLKQGKYDIALKFFEALAVLTKNNPYDLRTIGALHLQKGDNLSALNYLERSIQLEPTHSGAQLNRVKALFALGYKRQALQGAQSLIGNPDPIIANHAQALIASYS